MSVGIYKIVNLVNKKVYVGQSRNIEKRWTAHKRAAYLVDAPSYEYPIYRAIRKYGIENFNFEIVELCSVADLNEKEKFWISHYNSFFEGYNSTPGGGGSCLIPKENILGIFEDLKTTLKPHREIAKERDVSIEMVQGINTGRYWRMDIDYPIQKTERVAHLCAFEGCNEKISPKAIHCVEHYRLLSRKTEKPTREELKKLIRTESFVSLGKRFGVSDNAVRKWCRTYELPSKTKEIKSISDADWQEI